jgi:GT2 family glycosyltransferase/SAM-dependent methyltransferase
VTGVPTSTDTAYDRWRTRRAATLPSAAEARWLAAAPDAPGFVAVFLGTVHEASLATLEGQTYPAWTRAEGMSATEAARRLTQGVFLLVTDADALLEPHALHRVAESLRAQPADVVYADSDVLENGVHGHPFFKPQWSPELALSMDYVGPFVVLGPGGVAAALELEALEAQDVDGLVVRLVDARLDVVRIPDVLAGRARRPWQTRTTELEAVARRRGRGVDVEEAADGKARYLAWRLDPADVHVSIVVPTAFRGGHLQRCLESIRRRTSYDAYDVVVVTNVGRLPDDLELPDDVSVVAEAGEFNFSAVCNLGARSSAGEVLVFLNDDTEVLAPDWLERLLAEVQQPGVAIAGAKLVYPDGTLQLGGVLLAADDHGARCMGLGVRDGDCGYQGLFGVVRNTSSVSGAAMMVERTTFDALSGFDESIAIELSDVDFCLRAQAAGGRVAWTPRAVLRHHERASRGAVTHPEDHARFRQRWAEEIAKGDRYYNPNLSYAPGREFEIDVHEPPGLDAVYGARPAPGSTRPSAERFVPETMPGLIHAEHLARYRWAAQVVSGRRVLDAGCGVGYGTGLLAAAGADDVMGVDVSEEALESARLRGDRARFVRCDLRRLPFDDGEFDVAVCFEAIEHVERPHEALDELARVVREDGLLLLSSPNRDVHPPGNPHHIHEYTPAELSSELATRFRHVRIWRQQPWLGSLILGDAELAAADVSTELDVSFSKATAARPGDEVYTLAVASNGPIPELEGIAMLTGPESLQRWTGREEALEARIRALEGTLSWRVTRPLRALRSRLPRRS